MEKKTAMMPLDDLRPHPSRVKFFGNVEREDTLRLEEDISEHGLYEPLEALPDGRILSGTRRWKVLKELGYEAAETWVRDDLAGDEIAAEYRLLTAKLLQSPTGDLAEWRSVMRLIVLDALPDLRSRTDVPEEDLTESSIWMHFWSVIGPHVGVSDERAQEYVNCLQMAPEILIACQDAGLQRDQILELGYLSEDEQQQIVDALNEGMNVSDALEPVLCSGAQSAEELASIMDDRFAGRGIGCGFEADN